MSVEDGEITGSTDFGCKHKACSGADAEGTCTRELGRLEWGIAKGEFSAQKG